MGNKVMHGDEVRGAEIAKLFEPIVEAILLAPAENRQEAMRLEQDLEEVVAKGEKADDGRIATLVNGLLSLVPGAAGAAVSIFATPLLSGVAGQVTQMVLKTFGGRGHPRIETLRLLRNGQMEF